MTSAALSPDDAALLDAIARRVVDLRMAAPALFVLESARPLSFVASQTAHFFAPLATAFLPPARWERFAALLERRDALDALIARIEEAD